MVGVEQETVEEVVVQGGRVNEGGVKRERRAPTLRGQPSAILTGLRRRQRLVIAQQVYYSVTYNYMCIGWTMSIFADELAPAVPISSDSRELFSLFLDGRVVGFIVTETN